MIHNRVAFQADKLTTSTYEREVHAIRNLDSKTFSDNAGKMPNAV